MQTIELQKRILGDEHPDTLRFMNGLAKSYFNLDQYQENAMQLGNQVVEARRVS